MSPVTDVLIICECRMHSVLSSLFVWFYLFVSGHAANVDLDDHVAAAAALR